MNQMVEALEAVSKAATQKAGDTGAPDGAQRASAVDKPVGTQEAQAHEASFQAGSQDATARMPEMRAQAPHVVPPLTGDLFKAADSVSSGLSRFKFPDPPQMHIPVQGAAPASAQDAARQMREMTNEMIRVNHESTMQMIEANEQLQKLTISQTMVANGSTQTAKNGKQLLNGGQ